MRKMEFKIIFLYGLLLCYLFFGHILFVDALSSYTTYLDPIVWLILCVLTYVFNSGEKARYKSKIDKIQTIFIIILMYLMIYFSSGLLLGYVRSPYSHSFIGIARNVWSFVTVIVFQEYIRSVLVNYTNKKFYWYIIITIIFTLFELNFYQISSNFESGEIAFKYISSTVFPALIKNILFTYLAVVAGCVANLVYRIPFTLSTLVLPIFPDFNWFLKGITESMLPFIIYLFINRHEEQEYRTKRRKSNFKELPLTILFLIVLFFIAGFFQYKPISIMSNSMADVIHRGDVVIVEAFDGNPEKLDVQDIVSYQIGGSVVVHRIIEIKVQEDGSYLYRTKGDNNNAPDVELVELSQITGIVKFKIPKIGYPAVWLQEFLHQSAPTNIEAPK